MSLADSINDLASGTYTVTRRARPSVSAGLATEGAIARTFSIVASVQPASGREAQFFPEGTRVVDMRTVWTATEALTPGDAQYVADEIAIAGEAFEVVHVPDWHSPDETFWIAYASRIRQ